MYNFDQHIDSNLVHDVIIDILIKIIIRKQWKLIENKTKYGWITAYYQCKNLKIGNEKVLEVLAAKIGNENCEQAVKEIRKLSRNLHPEDIPIVAESILNDIYTITLLRRKNLRKDKWKILNYKQCLRKSIVFTICNTIES